MPDEQYDGPDVCDRCEGYGELCDFGNNGRLGIGHCPDCGGSGKQEVTTDA
jgi:hypothetical protein